jgi:DNA-binding FrmR family transcriptional regulator
LALLEFALIGHAGKVFHALPYPGTVSHMGHTTRNRDKLLQRVRRIQGQLRAVEKGLANSDECSAVLLTLTAARGGLNGLIAQIIEDHVREHIADPAQRPGTARAAAIQELLDVVRSYFR